MLNQLLKYYQANPLRLIMIVAVILRLAAAIFSKGYVMHDDHFLVVEAPQSFIDDFDYDDWKPENNGGKAEGHSLFYIGAQYIMLYSLEAVGIDDPQWKMFFIRLVHALMSLLIVYASYRITERISNRQYAGMVGLMMAALWFMPFLSVHNLVEFVCIIPLIWASWIAVKRSPVYMRTHILTGILCGIAVGIRFQAILFIAGWGLALLILKHWKGAFVYGVAAVLAYVMTQMGDLVWWDRPLVEIQAYIEYNLANTTSYFDRPWYQYIFTIGGILIPPMSLFFLFGYFKEWRRHLILFLPAFVFLIFHSYFPNKQERFILPAIPYILILGTVGFMKFKEQSAYWRKRNGLWKGLVVFAVTLNIIVLLPLTVTYSKRSRVETMSFLRAQSDFNNFIVESSHKGGFSLPPKFYCDQWKSYHYITTERDHQAYMEWLDFETMSPDLIPNYVLFYETENLDARINNFKEVVGVIDHVETVEPSGFDKLLHWLNPKNKNEKVEVYRIEKFYK